MASSKSPAPFAESFSVNAIASSCSPIDRVSLSAISPSSIFSFMRIIVTPVSFSPFAMARFIGAAPLYSGKSEACILRQCNFGRPNTTFDIIWPKLATINKSALIFFRNSIESLEFTSGGWKVLIPSSSAFNFTAVGAILRALPFCLSGWVTTRAISSLLASFSKIGAAKLELPKNTIFISTRFPKLTF